MNRDGWEIRISMLFDVYFTMPHMSPIYIGHKSCNLYGFIKGSVNLCPEV